ncbi:MAG TPA: HPr family phosphocarrier protein [Kiritimatiellia bacterium]|nr:HPr family phosphocarrier protein [Kiritimatiellia bacterium]HSA16994.1 HPr family phosphocarrier protein [Kiritimatiellia bacterium]
MTENRPDPAAPLTRELTIVNKFGIHARPAALFVKTASRFASEILVEKDGAVVSAKSIMGLLTIEGSLGTMLRLTATGADAVEALDALQELVEKKFYED